MGGAFGEGERRAWVWLLAVLGCRSAESEQGWRVVVNGELLERLHSAREVPGMGGSCCVTAMGLHTSQRG